MARKKNPSLTQYEKMLLKHDWNWEMNYEMKTLSAPSGVFRAEREDIENELIDYSLLSSMHNELYNAHVVYATEDGPKPKLVKVGKENGKTVYKIAHDEGDGLIFDWRTQHVRV